jgi:hypothetical protein
VLLHQGPYWFRQVKHGIVERLMLMVGNVGEVRSLASR